MQEKHIFGAVFLFLLFPIIALYSWLGTGPIKLFELPHGSSHSAWLIALVLIVALAILGVITLVWRVCTK